MVYNGYVICMCIFYHLLPNALPTLPLDTDNGSSDQGGRIVWGTRTPSVELCLDSRIIRGRRTLSRWMPSIVRSQFYFLDGLPDIQWQALQRQKQHLIKFVENSSENYFENNIWRRCPHVIATQVISNFAFTLFAGTRHSCIICQWKVIRMLLIFDHPLAILHQSTRADFQNNSSVSIGM